jgi:uncharacterized membrane protein YfcA
MLALTPTALIAIAAAVLASSFVSGVFGLAGGMILLGSLLVFFDVATAMVVFSILQLSGNIWRIYLWRQFILWRIVAAYVVGSLSAFALLSFIAYVPNKPFVYLLLGLMPFAVEAIPRAWRPNIERTGVPTASGFITSSIQLLAGNGGLLLDIVFQKSKLDRKTTVATKAMAQSFTHLMRMAYYIPLGGMGGAMPLWGYGASIVITIAGTSLAALLLERMSDDGFRHWTRNVIFAVSSVYLLRAAWLYWQG